MVSAIIMAGGSGTRTGQLIPKQFLTVNDIPVMIYTMLNIQRIPEIGKIVAVGPAGWEQFIYSYAKQFGISKLKHVVTGGKTRHESIYNGLCCIRDDKETNKVFLIDANRPMVPADVIERVIALADCCDCAVATEPCYDSMFISHDGKTITQNSDRSILFKGVGAECAKLSVLNEIYGDNPAVVGAELCTAGLAAERGKKVLMTKGHIKCFKITTADDFELFKAFLRAETQDK